MITITIHQPYIHRKLYYDAYWWLRDNFSIDDAYWDFNAGTSYINGSMYPAAVKFKHHSDAVMFKLMFLDLIKFK